LGKLNIRKRE
jgi:hypothetical protein